MVKTSLSSLHIKLYKLIFLQHYLKFVIHWLAICRLKNKFLWVSLAGSPQLELPRYAEDAESTSDSFMQFQSRTDNFEAGYGGRFTGSMSNNVYGEPLTPRSNRKIKAILRSVAFLAVPRKRARIAPPASQTTVLVI